MNNRVLRAAVAASLGLVAGGADAAVYTVTLTQVLTYSNNAPGGTAGNITSSTATFTYNDVTQLLTQTGGTFNNRVTTAPTSTLYRTSIQGLIQGNGASATASLYMCQEGNFGGNVGASICGNYNLGANFTNETTTTWGPGTAASRTLGGDDVASGPQQSIAFNDNFSTISFDPTPTTGTLVLRNATCTGTCTTLPANSYNSGMQWTLGNPVLVAQGATDDTANAESGVATDISILANDLGYVDPVTVTIQTSPNHGGSAVVLGSPGARSGIKITYRSAPSFVGTETFTYRANDGSINDTAVVTVTVSSVATVLSTPVDTTSAVNGLTDLFSATFDGSLSPCNVNSPSYCTFFNGQPGSANRQIVITPNPTTVANTVPLGITPTPPSGSYLNLRLNGPRTQLTIAGGVLAFPPISLTIQGGTANATVVNATGAGVVFDVAPQTATVNAQGQAEFFVNLAPAIAVDFSAFSTVAFPPNGSCAGNLCALIPILTLDMVKYRLVVDYDPSFTHFTASFIGQTGNNSILSINMNSVAPEIVVTDSRAPANDLQVPFGSVTQLTTATQTVTVANTGGANLLLGTVGLANPLAPPFALANDTCTGATVLPAAACTFNITFTPGSVGAFSDSLDIPSNDADEPVTTVAISGTGILNSNNPANDQFANRTVVSGGTTVGGTNIGATGEAGEPDHALVSTPLNSVWWSWSSPVPGQLTVSTLGSDFDTTLGVYVGSAVGALTEIASNDDFSGLTSRVSFRVTPGAIYAIAVDGFESLQGHVNLALGFVPDPADSDGDGILDTADNCILVPNPSQCDSDNDGYGNHCDADVNNDGFTNGKDSTLFRQQLGQPSVGPIYNRADINCNGFVNGQDTTLFRKRLGLPPGPSGLVP